MNKTLARSPKLLVYARPNHTAAYAAITATREWLRLRVLCCKESAQVVQNL